jgi:NADH-quinone oxidoreductase subunit N
VNYADLIGILPILVLVLASAVVMVVAAFHRSHILAAGLSLAAFLVAIVALLGMAYKSPRAVTLLFIVDDYALFFTGLILMGAAVVTVLSYGYFRHYSGNYEEFYVLLLLATMGAAVLVVSSHFVSFFLGLEVLSVALYGMIAYHATADSQRTSEVGIEAGLKYLILAGVSSGFLLFGMALVYATLGTMSFERFAPGLQELQPPAHLIALAGLAITMVGVGFKLAIVPFHMWTPDIYQGAPAPVSGYVATVSKGAMFALLLRYFYSVRVTEVEPLLIGFIVIAVASMIVGNVLALLQRSVKRLLAYSSIAHLGYLLVAFVSIYTARVTAAAFYLVAYFATMLSAFGIVGLLSRPEHEADSVDDYRGLFWQRPWVAMSMTTMMFSLIGIPLTIGFFAKLYILTAGVGSALWLLAIVLVVSSVVGLYYYLRVIVAMFLHPSEEEQAQGRVREFGFASPAPTDGNPNADMPTVLERVVLTVLSLGVLSMGIYPTALIRTIVSLVSSLTVGLP